MSVKMYKLICVNFCYDNKKDKCLGKSVFSAAAAASRQVEL